MRTIQVESIRKIKKAVPKIEKKLKIKVALFSNSVKIEGNELNEFIGEEVVRAVDFGFDVEDALLLLNEKFSLEFVNIKEHTHRKNFAEIRARLIGTKGKAKRTIEELTGAVLVIHNNMVGVIVDAEHLEQTIQGIILLIQGSKHANVFAYLEKQNAILRGVDLGDLGLKNPEKDKLES